MTMCGQLVYQRAFLEFKDKVNKRDMVVEENLIDVKLLLKNSAFSQVNMKQTAPSD